MLELFAFEVLASLSAYVAWRPPLPRGFQAGTLNRAPKLGPRSPGAHSCNLGAKRPDAQLRYMKTAPPPAPPAAPPPASSAATLIKEQVNGPSNQSMVSEDRSSTGHPSNQSMVVEDWRAVVNPGLVVLPDPPTEFVERPPVLVQRRRGPWLFGRSSTKWRRRGASKEGRAETHLRVGKSHEGLEQRGLVESSRCQMATNPGRSARIWPNGRPPAPLKALF
nr:unnamed protein product [Digitaria exilis]